MKLTAKARHEFEESVQYQEERGCGLLEELTPEILGAFLANIPAKAVVEISLAYGYEFRVVTSKKDKAEGLAITIATSIAPPYAPPASPIPSPDLRNRKLEINIRFLDGGAINPASCQVEPNHHVTYKGFQSVSNVLVTNSSELPNLDSTSSDT